MYYFFFFAYFFVNYCNYFTNNFVAASRILKLSTYFRRLSSLWICMFIFRNRNSIYTYDTHFYLTEKKFYTYYNNFYRSEIWYCISGTRFYDNRNKWILLLIKKIDETENPFYILELLFYKAEFQFYRIEITFYSHAWKWFLPESNENLSLVEWSFH